MNNRPKKEKNRPPLIIIGCGGTGQRILRLLKTKFLDEITEELYNSLPIEMLAVDTLIQQEEHDLKTLPKDDFLSLGPLQMDRFIHKDYEREEYIQKWFNRNQYAGLMSTGAMQIRPFGRLALFLNLKTVIARLNKKIQSVLDARHIIPEETEDAVFQTEAGSALQVHIVGNIGGGSGSGIMLDLAYLLRYISKSSLNINGHLIMPEAVQDVQIQKSLFANAYAFLKELDNFNLNPRLYSQSQKSSPIWRYLEQGENDNAPDIDLQPGECFEPITAPFDYTYLLSPYNLKNVQLNDDFFYEIISEKIFLCSMMSEVGKREYERVCNIRAQYLDTFYEDETIKGKPCAYASYSVSTLRVNTQTIQNKIKEHVVSKINSMFEDRRKQDLIISPELHDFIQKIKNKILWEDENFPDAHKAADIKGIKDSLAEWFSEQVKTIDKLLKDNSSIIQEGFLKILSQEKGLTNLNFKIEQKPSPLLADVQAIRHLDPNNYSQLLYNNDEMKTVLENNLNYIFYKKIEEAYRQFSKRCLEVKDWAKDFANQLNKEISREEKEFDNILFYNFDIKRITDYISHGPQEIIQMSDCLEAYNPKDKTQQELKALVEDKTLQIWNQFASLYREQENEPVEKRLTVSNFLQIMFKNDQDKLENVLESYRSMADPCWRYNEHFAQWIMTVALMGCKSDNHLFSILKDWGFWGADLEPTHLEDDPFEVPLVVSQYGLPLLGYVRMQDYKRAYQEMRSKFSSSKTYFNRQFHLDKRWEDIAQDPLIDIFENDLPGNMLHVNAQLFALAWYLGMISQENYQFWLNIPKPNSKPLQTDKGKSGLTDAMTNFSRFLDSLAVQHKGESNNLREEIKSRIQDKKMELGKDFKESLQGHRDNLHDLSQSISDEEDRANMNRLSKYITYYLENDFKLLSELKDSKFQTLIAELP